MPRGRARCTMPGPTWKSCGSEASIWFTPQPPRRPPSSTVTTVPIGYGVLSMLVSVSTTSPRVRSQGRLPDRSCGNPGSQVAVRASNEHTLPAVRRSAGALPASAGGLGDRRGGASVRRHRSSAPKPADNPLLHRRGPRRKPGQQADRRRGALHGHRDSTADRQRVGRVRKRPRRLGRDQRPQGRSREALPVARHVLPQRAYAGRDDRAHRRRRQRARRILLYLRHQPSRQRSAAARNTGPAIPRGLESGSGPDRVQRRDADCPRPDAPPVRGPLQGRA